MTHHSQTTHSVDVPLLHENATPFARDFFRTYVWALWFGALALDPLHQLASLPADGFMPAGLLATWPNAVVAWLLTPIGLILFKSLSLAVIAIAALSRRSVAVAVAACVLLLIYQCLVRGFGHINHAELLLLFAAFTFTYFDWQKDCASGAPLTAIAWVLCLSYTLTGLYRLGNGGLEIFASDSLLTWAQSSAASPRGFHCELGVWALNQPYVGLLLKLSFPLVTLMEILAPCCLFSRRFRVLFLTTMIPFHIGVLALMGILFWQNLALYILLWEFKPRKKLGFVSTTWNWSQTVPQHSAMPNG